MREPNKGNISCSVGIATININCPLLCFVPCPYPSMLLAPASYEIPFFFLAYMAHPNTPRKRGAPLAVAPHGCLTWRRGGRPCSRIQRPVIVENVASFRLCSNTKRTIQVVFLSRNKKGLGRAIEPIRPGIRGVVKQDGRCILKSKKSKGRRLVPNLRTDMA